MKLLLRADGRIAEGGTPFVMHNERLADPLDPIQRALAELTGKRKKTETDHREIARIEFYGGLYTDPVIPDIAGLDGQVVAVPAWNMLRCLQEGAKRHKRGKDVLRGVVPLAQWVELEYEGPKTPEALWKDGGFSLRKGVGIGGRRTMRTRPIFTDWRLGLPVEVDPVIFDRNTIVHLWADAGRYEALGDMRPIYGRFVGTVEDA